MKTVIVYGERGMYAGWPANHGSWQWGDEFLVGFMRGRYGDENSYHNICEPYQKMLARSLDGGETWVIETPNVDFEAEVVSPSPPFDLGNSIIRVCGYYDTGGERCCSEGGFYLSRDRGHTWAGAYAFTGADELFESPMRGTSRTCVLGNLVFVSTMKDGEWATDKSYCLIHDGVRFHLRGVICSDEFRAVMPSVALVEGRIVATLRRRGNQSCWIDAFGSDDDGKTWSLLSKVWSERRHNGNPPALAAIKDKLYCAFGHRQTKSICLRESRDGGKTWSGALVVNRGDTSDVGYPRLFVRSDGSLVCVYYCSVNGEEQSIRATIMSADDLSVLKSFPGAKVTT